MPLISVIIPTFNRQDYIAETIQSVLDQTYQEFEIIVVDNCSTDNTINVVKTFSDNRIRVLINEQNIGVAGSTNNGIRNAKGKYIAWIGSDDIWVPEKLQIQVDFLEEHPEIEAVFSHVELINENGNIIPLEQYFLKNVFNVNNKTRHEWLKSFFDKGNCLNFPSSLIRHKCFSELGLFNPALACLADFDMWIRICLHYEIHVIDNILVKFRVFSDSSNESADTTLNRIRDRYEMFCVLDNYLSITDPKELLLIFPEVAEFGIIQNDIIPYFLGIYAIQNGYDIKELWGLNNIRLLLQNERKAHLLDECCNFSYNNFHILVKSYDIFKNEKINTVNKVVEERDQTISSLSSRLTERDQTICILINQSAERDKEIKTLTAQLNERDEEIMILVSQSDERDQLIHKLSLKISEQDTNIQKLTDELYKNKIKLAENDQEILRYALSNSWRLTRILRNVRKNFSRKRDD